MSRYILFVAASMLVLTGCASATYKARNKGFTRFGYEVKELDKNRFEIKFYGAKRDSHEKLKAFWMRRARELCGKRRYQSEIHQGSYLGKSLLILPPVIIFKEGPWPVVSGIATCRS